MTGDSLNPEQPPSGPLYARQSASTPDVGTQRVAGGGSGPQAGAEDFGSTPPALRDRYAAAIYEYNNPGMRWADAHPDDLICYGGDADAALAIRDAELERVRAQVARAQAVHRVSTLHDAVPEQPAYCINCRFTWPCPTTTALNPQEQQ